MFAEDGSPEGVIVYDYDDLGRKTSTSIFAAGAGTSTATPERVTSYVYDSLGRLAGVSEDLTPADTSDAQLETSYGYDMLGNLQRTDLPGGVIEHYDYDDLNRLDVLTHYAPDLSPDDLSNNDKLAEFDYEVRADGKRESVKERYWLDDGGPQPRMTDIFWTYDEIGRLIEETINHFDNELDRTDAFIYRIRLGTAILAG